MYLPNTSEFPNRAYSSRRFADVELHKAKSSISSLAKIVAFIVVLIIMTVAGLSGLGIITMQNQNTTDTTIDAMKQDVQANLGDLTALKNRIEQLEKSDQQHEASHVADVATMNKKIEQLEKSNQQMTSNATTMTDAVAMDINSLKDEFKKLSNNQSESRGHLETITNLVENVQKSQNASEIASRDYQIDNNRQLQTLNETLIEVQKKGNAPVQQVLFNVNTPTGRTIDGTPEFENIVLNEGGAYNAKTGLFKCPVKGVYLFTLTIVSVKARSDPITCSIRQGKIQITTALNMEGPKESASFSTVLHLSVDEIISLPCNFWGQAEKGAMTSYSGVLIRAD